MIEKKYFDFRPHKVDQDYLLENNCRYPRDTFCHYNLKNLKSETVNDYIGQVYANHIDRVEKYAKDFGLEAYDAHDALSKVLTNQREHLHYIRNVKSDYNLLYYVKLTLINIAKLKTDENKRLGSFYSNSQKKDGLPYVESLPDKNCVIEEYLAREEIKSFFEKLNDIENSEDKLMRRMFSNPIYKNFFKMIKKGYSFRDIYLLNNLMGSDCNVENSLERKTRFAMVLSNYLKNLKECKSSEYSDSISIKQFLMQYRSDHKNDFGNEHREKIFSGLLKGGYSYADIMRIVESVPDEMLCISRQALGKNEGYLVTWVKRFRKRLINLGIIDNVLISMLEPLRACRDPNADYHSKFD
ncbi:MAG: hypothetical protein WC570_03815 [Patescibacteria group bacterium]